MFKFPFRTEKKQAGDQACIRELHVHDQHMHERAQFKAVLESFSASRIKERLVVLDIFLSTEEHLTLSSLEEIIRAREPELLDHEFLLETMEMFCNFGFAQKRTFETRETLYEHHHVGAHHDHFICTRCGKIQEFVNPDLERLQMETAAQFQFHPLQHKMEIYGLCSSCMASRESLLPLCYAANGERVRIVQMRGGREVQARLGDMGLAVGTCLEIISNNPSGPSIVAFKDTRLAINSGIAQKIMVAHSCRHAEEP